MNTPTETPGTDAALHEVTYGSSRFSFPEHARKMERERDEARRQLAAVTKERDDAVAKGENITHQLGMAMMELTEANADRARLREALEKAQAFIASAIPMTTVRSGVVHNDRALVECELATVQQLQANLEAALSTPPPPVVPREELSCILDNANNLLEGLKNGDFSEGNWSQSLIDALETSLTAYRAKHPTSNLTSRGDVAG
jgi:hypothetical protein